MGSSMTEVGTCLTADLSRRIRLLFTWTDTTCNFRGCGGANTVEKSQRLGYRLALKKVVDSPNSLYILSM